MKVGQKVHWQECQQRCLNTEGCVYFNAFPNGGCHITDGRDGTSIGEYRQDVIDLDPSLAKELIQLLNQEEQALHTGGCVAVNTGISDRVKGAFNAKFRNKDGKENDYCRFIGSQTDPFGVWLSCVSLKIIVRKTHSIIVNMHGVLMNYQKM